MDDELGFQTAAACIVESVSLQYLLGMHQPTVMEEGERWNGKDDLSALCSIGIKVLSEFLVNVPILIFWCGGEQSYENFCEKELTIKKRFEPSLGLKNILEKNLQEKLWMGS